MAIDSTLTCAIPICYLLELMHFVSLCCSKCKIVLVVFNPLNTELNPICHLLALLGAQPTFHISRIRIKENVWEAGRNDFQYISNKMQHYKVYYICSTCFGWCYHPRIQLYLQHLVFVTLFLLPAAMSSSTIAAASSNGVTNTSCYRYSCMHSWWWVEVSPETCRAVSR